MRRRRASTKMNNAVHSGWMVKSPPERKLNAPFKIFRSEWKRRYFVLRKPSGSLPDQYELHYYKDEKCASKKGSIDLEQCEQIIESLDSEQFPYLLAIKTVCRNKVRTYYLAVDTEQEMGSWVQWLCHVCGMKQEDDPTDLPEPRSPSVTTAPTLHVSSSSNVSNGRTWNHTSSATTTASTTSTTNATTTPNKAAVSQPLNISHKAPSESSLDSSPSYIPLDNCTTGKPQRVDLSGSVESVPDFNAPSPPLARSGQHDTGTASGNEDDVFLTGSYPRPPKHQKEPAPPPRSTASIDLYTVPPVRPPRPAADHSGASGDHSDDNDGSHDRSHNTNSTYDVPPPRRRSPKRSTDSVGRKDSFGSGRYKPPSECYDYPPPRLSSTTSSDCDVAAASDPSLPSPYQNIPPTSKSSSSSSVQAANTNATTTGFDLNVVVPPPRAHQLASTKNQGYDIPRAPKNRSSSAQGVQLSKLSIASSPSSSLSTTTGSINNSSQAPPRPHRPSAAMGNSRNYFNTQDGQLLENPSSSSSSNSNSNNSKEEYTNISNAAASPPAIPPPRHHSNSDSGSNPAIYHIPPPPSSASSSTSSSSSIVPPARPPARSANTNNPPPIAARNPDLVSSLPNQEKDDGGVIFSTTRTRSFKKHHNINVPIMKSNKSSTLPMMTVPVPAPRPVPHHSAEEGDEETTHHPISLLRSVPPSVDSEPELKYIDLELPDSTVTQDTPGKSTQSHHHHSHHSHSHNHTERSKPDSSIEYREIDFVRTKALKDTKKEKDRQNDDHNT